MMTRMEGNQLQREYAADQPGSDADQPGSDADQPWSDADQPGSAAAESEMPWIGIGVAAAAQK